MRAEQLLLLYPRAWRERYGDEFLATAGSGPMPARQALDVLFGAIDAWISADVRRITVASQTPRSEGGPMSLKAFVCQHEVPGVTPRDGLVGAAVMLGVSTILKLFGLNALAFPVSFTLSMPFWLMKGVPRVAQLAIVGGTLVLLGVIR